MLFTETVEAGTLELIRRLLRDKKLNGFDLAGDTALSLQIGHRISRDIELSAKSSFDAANLSDHLSKEYKAGSVKTLKNEIRGFIDEVKVGLVSPGYPLIKPPVTIGEIRMLSLEDIGAGKLNAIAGEAPRFEDLADIYKLLEHLSLEELMDAYEGKYPKVNRLKMYKSLQTPGEIEMIAIGLTGPEIRMNDLAYRFRKAVKEPKRIFEAQSGERPAFKKRKY
jgi:hypothetical protein